MQDWQQKVSSLRKSVEDMTSLIETLETRSTGMQDFAFALHSAGMLVCSKLKEPLTMHPTSKAGSATAALLTIAAQSNTCAHPIAVIA